MNEVEREQAIKHLTDLVEAGGRKVYVQCKHVSQSGMLRHLSFFVINPIANSPETIDHLIAQVLDYKRVPWNKGDGLKVHGCGMDMGFAVVHDLGRVLYPKGDGHTITGRNGDKEPETDGGYLLKHCWM